MAIQVKASPGEVPAILKRFEKEWTLVCVVPCNDYRELYFEQKTEPTPRYLRGTGPG